MKLKFFKLPAFVKVLIFLGFVGATAQETLRSYADLGPSSAAIKELTRAQSSELKAIQHRYSFELKELKASQELRRKDWEKREREARYKYFAEHPDGAIRRKYIQDFIKRREAFLNLLKDERTHHSEEQTQHLKEVRQQQGENLASFKKALLEGKDPPAQLWPKAGL